MPIPPDLPTILRQTTEQMASACSAPIDLWCRHSNAVLEAANEIERLRVELEGAAHNRFFDQRDAYFEGKRDAGK